MDVASFSVKFTSRNHFLWYYTKFNTETCLNPAKEMGEIVCTTKKSHYEQNYVLPWGILQQYNPWSLEFTVIRHNYQKIKEKKFFDFSMPDK